MITVLTQTRSPTAGGAAIIDLTGDGEASRSNDDVRPRKKRRTEESVPPPASSTAQPAASEAPSNPATMNYEPQVAALRRHVMPHIRRSVSQLPPGVYHEYNVTVEV